MFRPTAMLALALALVALALPGTAAARGRLLGAFAGTAPVLTDGVRPLAAASPSGHVSYGGGPVMHSTKTFVIYWDPAGALGADYEALVNRYLADVAADTGTQTNVYSVATEYGDASARSPTTRASAAPTSTRPRIRSRAAPWAARPGLTRRA